MLGLALLGCKEQRTPAVSGRPAASAMSLAARESSAVLSFLECIECVDGELMAVEAMGDSALPLLGQLLIDGPPADRADRLRSHLDSQYLLLRDDLAQSGESEETPDRDAYLKVALDNNQATYRSRAAFALGRLRSADARRLLDSALRLDSSGAWPRRPEVTARIRAALHRF